MKALQLTAYGEPPHALEIVDREVPRPKNGEVLVRIEASPVNPSDLSFLRGLYVKKKLPVVPGFEGSGTVVGHGGGMMARALMGRRVACSANVTSDGTWAQYMCTPSALCFPLLPSVDLEAGSMLIVNPLTAVALLDVAKRAGAKAVVQTAAASALGKMLVRLSQRWHMPMIHVVRRRAQVDALRALGAEHVLDSSVPEFDQALRALATDLRATVALDAVGGAMTTQLLQAMPRNSRAILYGALSTEPIAITPAPFIFEGKRIEGFWLSQWLRTQSLPNRLRAALTVQCHLSSDFKSEVRARISLEEAQSGIDQYAQVMSSGKVLFVPNRA
ncbi:MAG: zinc-binding dehydrogenase [Polyangiales bacterium]